MSGIIDICVTTVNVAGRAFCDYAAGMFVQIAVLVAVLLCIDWLSRKRIRATLRYWIWMLVFVKLLLPPSLCVPTGIGYWLGRGEALPAPSVVPQIVEVAKLPAPTSVELPIATPVVRSAESVPTVVRLSDSIAESRASLTWQGGVLLAWIAGVLVFAGLVVQRWRFVKELIARSEPAPEDFAFVLDGCRRRMGVRRKVDVRLLPEALSPAVCGLLHPTILVPRELLNRLSPEGIRTVLIHELAHVRRGDLWANSLQTALQVVYFYNPLVWLASAIVRRVREQAVDEMSLVALGAEARSYGNTLIDIAEMAFLRPSPALRLIGVAESRKSLEGRIKHMMTRPIPKSARVGAIGVLFVVAIGAILLPMARAQRQDAPTAAAQETSGAVVATLPDGTTVELVGLCQDPTAKGQQWWRPDGALLTEPEYELKGKEPWKYPAFGYLLRFSRAEDLSYRSQTPLIHLPFTTGPVTKQGQAVVFGGENTQSGESLPNRTDIEVDVAVGQWSINESEQSHARGSVFQTPDGRILILSGLRPNPKENTSSRSVVDVTTTSDMVYVELEGTAADGRRIRSVWEGDLVAKGQLIQHTFGFPVAAQEIKAITVKQRPFHRVVFRDVSLRPRHKTDVQVSDEGEPSPGVFRQYDVNRSVADFPAGEDFSTPEAAYATINRMDQSDPAAWKSVSVAHLAARMGGSGSDRKKTVDPEWAKVLGKARIREVVVWNVTKAAVIAELPQELSSKKILQPFDRRSFELEKGRWLNTGNSRFNSIEEAKAQFMGWMRRETSQADAMRDPLAHADEIKAAAGQLFDKLRAADYAKILSYYRNGKWANDGWKQFPTLGLYTVHTDYPSFALWCATHFKDNPIASVQLGDVFISDALVADKTGRPTVPYKVTLKDGSVLAGNLPFYLSQGKWLGLEGIDWHLWPNETR